MLIISIVLFCLSVLVLFVYAFRKNNNFINLRGTISNYTSIFKNKNNKYLKGQLFIFFGIPCTLSIATTIIKPIDDTFLNLILLVITIFISMFFAMLSIIISFGDKQAKNNKLVKETCDSLIFENFICVIIILIALIYNLFPNIAFSFIPKNLTDYLAHTADFFIYYLLYCLLLNLFIVLKRIRVLIHYN